MLCPPNHRAETNASTHGARTVQFYYKQLKQWKGYNDGTYIDDTSLVLCAKDRSGNQSKMTHTSMDLVFSDDDGNVDTRLFVE